MAADAGERKTLEFTILEDYDKGESLEEVARDFALFRELGIRTWRGSLGWDDYEPTRGRYDFDWLHRFARLAADSGIALRPYLGYTPEWAGADRRADGQTWNDPPKDTTAWPRFVGAVATALRGHPNVRSYELYNEVNTRLWWDGTAEEYAEAFRLGATAVRRAHPGVQVIAAGLVWPDAAWMETVCERSGRGSVDAVAVHAYHETWTPAAETIETFGGESYRSQFLPTLDEACGRTPVWANEAGYATTNGRTERDQALWWARAIATFAATPRVAQIGVYEIKDLRPNEAIIGDAENRHLGITDTTRRRKAAFFTVQRLVALLGGPLTVTDGLLGIVERPLSGGGVVPDAMPASDSGRAVVHAFSRPDGRQVVIAWVPRGVAPRRVSLVLPRPGRGAIAYGLDGRGAPLDGRAVGFDSSPAPFPGNDGRRLELALHRDQVAIVVVAP